MERERESQRKSVDSWYDFDEPTTSACHRWDKKKERCGGNKKKYMVIWDAV